MRRVLVLAVSATIVGLTVDAGASAPSLTGRGVGHWHYVEPTVPDLPGANVMHGHGTFGGETAAIAGRMIGLGFVASGRCTVRLHLSTKRGTIAVRGASIKRYRGFSNCGRDFTFHWHSARPTGNYAGQRFTGRGHIRLRSAAQTASRTRRFVIRLS